MSGWSRQQSLDEAAETALFARRSRALGEPELPPLDAVLAAARSEARVQVGTMPRAAWSRVVVATGLVAACVLGAVARLPRPEVRRVIVADVDAGAPRVVSEDPRGGEVCSSSDGVFAAEPRACFDPGQLLSAGMTVAPAQPTPAPAPAECETPEPYGSCTTCGGCESATP